ncbi:MAG: SGNH/GDSL hydrolase family protein [Isosphaeraceae bacterium]|nr:SGNH/GDSL hydrolase family protein [Isosphaeraceae bacterium]
MSQGILRFPRRDVPGSASPVRSARICFAATLAVLVVGLVPLPSGWNAARTALDSARLSELSRSEREANVPGYYEGLIGGGNGSAQGARSELSLRLLGKPAQWTRDNARDITQHLTGDFLQFELVPNQDKVFLDRPFRTNPQGQRDHPYTREKPSGTFRIAVLGSSMDMGWGVTTEETYVNLLEGWLNEHAAKRGVDRRFEVLNFAVAAYAPLQRLESYRRKAREYQPDMVIYSATLLDLRLTEIHLCDVYSDNVKDLPYEFLRRIVAESGLNDDDLRRDAEGRLFTKERIKQKLRPRYWSIYDGVLGTLAADCRSEGLPLACVIVPRVGSADAPEARAETVARLRGIAAHHALTLFDLSNTFDHVDPSQLEIAAWDDHPNALGHKRLFLALARHLVKDRTLYDTLFPAH